MEGIRHAETNSALTAYHQRARWQCRSSASPAESQLGRPLREAIDGCTPNLLVAVLGFSHHVSPIQWVHGQRTVVMLKLIDDIVSSP